MYRYVHRLWTRLPVNDCLNPYCWWFNWHDQMVYCQLCGYNAHMERCAPVIKDRTPIFNGKPLCNTGWSPGVTPDFFRYPEPSRCVVLQGKKLKATSTGHGLGKPYNANIEKCTEACVARVNLAKDGGRLIVEALYDTNHTQSCVMVCLKMRYTPPNSYFNGNMMINGFTGTIFPQTVYC